MENKGIQTDFSLVDKTVFTMGDKTEFIPAGKSDFSLLKEHTLVCSRNRFYSV